MNTKFYITDYKLVTDGEDIAVHTEVQGIPIKIEGWEEYDFFIYKSKGGYWVPSDGKTGACLKEGYFKTQKEAIEALQNHRPIAERNYKSYNDIVAMIEATIGLTPRYREEKAIND